MDIKSKVLLGAVIFLVALSISATFYKTVILQDFEIDGMGVYVEEGYSYAWYTYNGTEYEVEADSDSYTDLQEVIRDSMGFDIFDKDPEFADELQANFEEAKLEM